MSENKDYLKEAIEKKAADLQKNSPYVNFPLPIEELIEILNEGARIQQEFDSIAFIQETYCLDNFEDARDMWEGMKEYRKTYPLGGPQPKTPLQEILAARITESEIKEVDEHLENLYKNTSSCCRAAVRIAGADEPGGVTNYHICTSCNEPCDVVS